ncbi:hypothetical protein [Edaphobacter sp. 12200R-103]|jgi:hypothetical protein|uniref:hypothetical protein n=1 Tax=Edaphobacter sp. 12200R-103 TaxID=2703788 RepID=UPI00138B521D|nr:hypothetical protein [Edaphobacter sp. 12200R-103]QHS51347.1 hypothetical protein GWR55_06025 [Edaphobacter sp. 12200R-103]
MQSIPAKVDRKEAYRIVSLLAHGMDPDQPNKALPADILHRPNVIRALFLAAEALQKYKNTTEAREGRVGKPWSREEDDELKDEIHRQVDLQVIASNHQRSSGAIIARMVHLDLFVDRDAARAHFRQH